MQQPAFLEIRLWGSFMHQTTTLKVLFYETSLCKNHFYPYLSGSVFS